MGFKNRDRVWENTSSSALLDFVLAGAIGSPYEAFNATGNYSDGDTFKYCAFADAQWETATGTYVAAGNKVTRPATVDENSLGTTAKINFASPPQIFVTFTAGFAQLLIGSATGSLLTSANGGLPSWTALGTGVLTALTNTAGAAGGFATYSSLGTAAFTASSAYDVAGAAAAVTPTTLGLVIGTNTQAYAANLTTWAGKTPYAGTVTVTTGKTGNFTNSITISGTDSSTLNVGTGGTLGTAAYTASSAYDVAGAAVTPTTLGLVIGTNTQAYNANLTAINQALTTTSSPSFTTVTAALTGHASLDLAFAGGTISGTVTGPDSGTWTSGGLNNVAKQSVIINGGFTINQRTYVSAATLAAGAYGHDRWKAGASGGNYSFTQLKSSTAITIATSKSLIQVVEDVDVVGGTYTLSWTGTATARCTINSATPSGNFAVSPITVTGQTAGTTMSVEFTGANAAGGSSVATNAGTLGTVKLETGSVATPYVEDVYSVLLEKCLRYCSMYIAAANTGVVGPAPIGFAISTTIIIFRGSYVVPMRTVPTLLTSAGLQVTGNLGTATPSSIVIANDASGLLFSINATLGSPTTAGASFALIGTTANSDYLLLTAEL
jgi:hypothetical protein